MTSTKIPSDRSPTFNAHIRSWAPKTAPGEDGELVHEPGVLSVIASGRWGHIDLTVDNNDIAGIFQGVAGAMEGGLLSNTLAAIVGSAQHAGSVPPADSDETDLTEVDRDGMVLEHLRAAYALVRPDTDEHRVILRAYEIVQERFEQGAMAKSEAEAGIPE